MISCKDNCFARYVCSSTDTLTLYDSRFRRGIRIWVVAWVGGARKGSCSTASIENRSTFAGVSSMDLRVPGGGIFWCFGDCSSVVVGPNHCKCVGKAAYTGPYQPRDYKSLSSSRHPPTDRYLEIDLCSDVRNTQRQRAGAIINTSDRLHGSHVRSRVGLSSFTCKIRNSTAKG